MNIDDGVPYLNKLDEMNRSQPKTNTERLRAIHSNITKYMDEKAKKQSSQRINTRYNNPIEKSTFDKIFLNMNSISKIYISSDFDRAIFEMKNKHRYVFYVHNKTEKDLIEKIINTLMHPVKIIVVCDKSQMTDQFGHLYCKDD